MLLGAWPIGGIKHSSLPNSNEKGGKCRFIILLGCYALFLIIGAAIFSVIEAPQLEKYNRDLSMQRTNSHSVIHVSTVSLRDIIGYLHLFFAFHDYIYTQFWFAL